jgi:hypothetical protein
VPPASLARAPDRWVEGDAGKTLRALARMNGCAVREKGASKLEVFVAK